MLALLVTAAALGVQCLRHLESLRRYHVPVLPAFDSYVYFAMAEHPMIFTVAPWGHRVAAPWIAHVLPASSLDAAFRAVTLGAFALASLLLFAFLRHRGHRPWAAALGAAAFLLSPPVGELVAAPFLADPLACASLVALLLALEVDAGLAVLVLLAVLGTLAKEVVILFLPAVFFARRAAGTRRAILEAGAVVAAAIGAAVLLRLAWTPGVSTPLPDLGPERMRLISASLAADPGRWLAVLAVGGLLPAAALGAFRAPARRDLPLLGWLVVAALLQPVLAQFAIQQVVGEVNRYLVYAVPALVPLALVALDRVAPNLGPRGAPLPRSRRLTAATLALTAAVVAAPLFAVDHYRRLDLGGRRDGLYVLGFCQGTLNTARKLRDGVAVPLRMEERRFAPRGFEAAAFDRMRWFLRAGWGDEPWYGTDEALMQDDRATLVLPCLTPAPLELTLAMSGATDAPLRASVNGHPLGESALEPDRTRLRFEVPAEDLFRGDNEVTLEVEGAAAARVRLYAVTYSPLTPRSP